VRHVEYAYTEGMDEAEIERRLRETETGVLAFPGGPDAHAVPVAHHYEDGSLYFRLGLTEAGGKRARLAADGEACYVVYGTAATDAAREIESWSVVVRGELTVLTGAARERFDTTEINRRFSPIRVFGEAIEDVEVAIVELAPATVTGRATAEG
jgi:nitroimidazol reductase NimA-like FMN-containing flavoprotein (pyridoxamine 5'-phosphate oxidase superfamily)